MPAAKKIKAKGKKKTKKTKEKKSNAWIAFLHKHKNDKVKKTRKQLRAMYLKKKTAKAVKTKKVKTMAKKLHVKKRDVAALSSVGVIRKKKKTGIHKKSVKKRVTAASVHRAQPKYKRGTKAAFMHRRSIKNLPKLEREALWAANLRVKKAKKELSKRKASQKGRSRRNDLEDLDAMLMDGQTPLPVRARHNNVMVVPLDTPLHAMQRQALRQYNSSMMITTPMLNAHARPIMLSS